MPTVDASSARIQNDLFDLGADLCVPDRGTKPGYQPPITDAHVKRLEDEIDAMNAGSRRCARSCCRAALAAAATCMWHEPFAGAPSG